MLPAPVTYPPASEVWVRGSQLAADVWRWAMPSSERRAASADMFAGIAPIGPDARTFAAWFAARFPESAQDTIVAADRLIAGTVPLFGREVPLVPADDTWHRDWITGGAMPRGFQRWIRRPAMGACGDVKRVWEINRHQWLVRLGQAAVLTGAPQYARAARSLLVSWMRANPPHRGINWHDALELSIRLLAWWTALPLFGDAPRQWPEWPALLRSAERQLRSVEAHLSYFSSPNTHLLGEGLALFVGALQLPGASRAGRWREQGYAILAAELDRQVSPDGGHREKSAYYHCYALEMLLVATIVGRRGGVRFPADWDARLGAMSEVLRALTQPDGSLSRIGDDDGGRLLALGAPNYYRTGDLLATAAAVLHRTDLLAGLGGEPPPALGWLLGREAVDALGTTALAPPASGAWFPEMGIGAARTSWDAQAAWCSLQGAPLGMLSAGHSHAGMGSVEICLAGRPLVVDPGTFSYHAHEWRDHFRRTDAHNGLSVGGTEPHTPAGVFRMRDQGLARAVRGGASAGRCAGVVVRYVLQAGDVTIEHHRDVVLLGPRRVEVRDEVSGDGVHPVTLRWHLAAGCRATPTTDPRAFTIIAGGRCVARLRLSGPMQEASVRPGWVSPGYDQKEPGDVVVFQATTVLPARWVCEWAGEV